MDAIRSTAVEFLTLHQKSIVDQVDALLENALGVATTPSSQDDRRVALIDALFLQWYDRFGVPTVLPDRTEAMARLAQAVPAATREDCLLAVVRAEMRGFAEADARRSLEKQFGIVRPRGRSSFAQPAAASPPNDSRSDTVTPKIQTSAPPPSPDASSITTSATIDTAPMSSGRRRGSPPPPALKGGGPVESCAVARALPAADPFAEEIRDWIIAVLRPGGGVVAPYVAALATAPHVVDALRDGVVLTALLHMLGQTATPPHMVEASVNDSDDLLKKKIPKRTDGFFKRDNVAKCLMDIAVAYPQLNGARMVDVGDVCDGKNDRAVVTFLLNLARAAVHGGYTGPVPILLRYDNEIEAQKISEADVDAAVATLLVEEKEHEKSSRSKRGDGAVPVPPPLPGTDTPVFVADGRTSKRLEPPRTRPIAVLSLSPGLHEPTKPVDRVVSKQSVTDAVASLKASEPPPGSSELAGSGGGGGGGGCYFSRKGDTVDETVGEIFNRTLHGNPRTQTRLKRLAHEGAYVVYHRITGKRTVVHIRAIRSTLMIRVGGGWDEFEDWLGRHASIDVL